MVVTLDLLNMPRTFKACSIAACQLYEMLKLDIGVQGGTMFMGLI